VKPLSFMMILLGTAACSDGSQPKSASTPANPTIARADSGLSTRTGFRPGFYFGSWNDSYRTRWLVLYVDRGYKGATYDAGKASGLCNLKMHNDTVEFTTNGLTFWQTDEPFTFSFVGKSTATGLDGSLVMNGGPYNGRAFPTRFAVYPLDATQSSADTALEGMYTSVVQHEETGDLSGDELLLIKVSQGFAAFYTYYEGGPGGPYPVDSVAIHVDTVAITGKLFGPDRVVSRTFILHPHISKLNANTGSSGESEKPTDLIKKAGIPEVFSRSSANQCAKASQRKG
jgi:hypothetical protein